MAVEYSFYVNTYHGQDIPEENWDAAEARAHAQLDQYKRLFTVEAPDENSESMAICAMADKQFFFDNSANVASSSIGSVSTTFVHGDTSPAAQAKEVYASACLYLNIYRGINAKNC